MSYSPTEEVMLAGPPVTISHIPGRSNGQHSSADQYCGPSRSNSSAQSISLSSRSQHQSISLQQLPQQQQQQQQQTDNREMTLEPLNQRPSPRHQESFDINGWPEGIEKPTRFLGMKVKPVSQWSIKHIFCLSY